MPDGERWKLEDFLKPPTEEEAFVGAIQAKNTETGETIELGRKDDNTLWLEGFHVADYNPSTGGLTPSNDLIVRRNVQATFNPIAAIREKAMPSPEPTLGIFVRAKETDEERISKLIALGGIDEAEAQKITATSKLSLSAAEWLEKVKEIDPSFRKGFFDSLTMRSIAAGYGDLVAGIGGIAGWIGLDNIHKNTMDLARQFRRRAPPQETWDVSLETVLDPRFWSTVVARALPYSVAMLPVSIATFGISAAALPAIGLGTWTTHLLASAIGGVSGAVLESSFEAGGVWNEAKAMGFSDEEAGEAAQSTLLKGIGALTGTNAIELFAMFLPDPTKILSRLVGRGLVTITRVGGKITFVGLTEAGEEAVQDVISRQALGQEVKLDDDMKMQMLVGFLMGAGMGGGADVLTTISNRTVNRLPDEHFVRWETEYNRLKADGATDEQATIAALDIIADEEVNKITDEITEATIKEEAIKSVKPKSRAEELSSMHDLRKAEAEAGVSPEVEEVVAAPEVEAKTKAALTNRIQQVIDKKGFLTKKGIPNAEVRKIYKEFRPKGGLKGMNKTQLRGILQRINESRPKRIEGRRVITKETEQRIVALRSTLMRANVLSDLGYERIGNMLGLTTDRYVDKTQFLTESEGKKLIREVNRQAELGLVERDARVVEALKDYPDVAKRIEGINRRIEKPMKGLAWFKLPKAPALGSFWDMTRYYQELQRATEQAEGRFFDVFSSLVRQANINDQLILGMDSTLKEACPEVKNLVHDKEACERIAAQLRDESPADITPDELMAANQMRNEYDTVKNMIRYHRVHWGIDLHKGNAELIAKDIYDAPLEDIQEAVRQWETGGEQALARYLSDKDWGIVQSGYDPRITANPKVELTEISHIRISKTELYGRKIDEIPSIDDNVFRRRRTYFKRLFALELEPYFKEMERMFEATKPFLKNPQSVSNVITQNILEFRGYFPKHLLTKMAMKTGGFAFSIYALSPHMSIRNLHQNIVLHPDVVSAMHPANKLLSDTQQAFTNVHVQQDIAIKREWLMQEALGSSQMARLVRWTSYYHKSDRINRLISMWLSTNKAQRALEASQRSGKLEDYLKGSAFYDLQLLEQRYILETKALPEVDFGADIPIMTGDEAAILEQARLRTEKSHFRYKRRERAPVEQGEIGRVFGSLMTFPRGYVQNMYDYFQKLDPRIDVPFAERARVAKNVIMVVAGSIVANTLYGSITGKGREPYDPTEILSWTFGGLAVGAVQQVTELWGDTFRAATGDEDALGRVIIQIPRTAEMFLPFYKQAIDITEAIIGKRYVDRLALRKIKEAFSEAYKVQRDYYEAPRTIIQMAQHILFGTTYIEQTEEEQEKARGVPSIIPEPKGKYSIDDLLK